MQTMLRHLTDALAETSEGSEEFTVARNRLTAYRRYQAKEVRLDRARYLMTKGNTCAVCAAWSGEE